MRDKSLRNYETAIALALLLIAVVYRVMPHPQNFTPVTSIAIFAAATLPAGMAFLIPVLAMIASDLFIGPHSLFWLTWGAFALTGFLGLWLRTRRSALRIILASAAGSTFFFVVTNLGVFFFENLYPRTWAGFTECFVMAVPFYRSAFLGDLLFSSLLFGLLRLALFSAPSAAALSENSRHTHSR